MLPRVKFLLVDDLEENLLALEALLRREDLDILKARSGPEALELLLVHDFALAFLDVQMPGMDGFELAELMRGNERSRQIPLIFMTAGAYDQHRLFKGYETGAVDFLYKPVNPYIIKNKANVFYELYRQKQILGGQLEEKIETLRLNEMFTAVLGHDLRNPLGAILNCGHLLERSEEELSRTCGQRILSSGRRMRRMIDDVLDMARARLGDGLAVVREPADFGRIVARIVEEQRMAHPDARIETSVTGDMQGRWDGERVAQLASNLIENALQHGEKHGAIGVHLDGRAADSVTMSIANDGSIPEHRRLRLFEPFQAQDSAARGPGLGLGLYIAKRIVDAHEGRINVDCQAGRTVLSIVLPRLPKLMVYRHDA